MCFFLQYLGVFLLLLYILYFAATTTVSTWNMFWRFVLNKAIPGSLLAPPQQRPSDGDYPYRPRGSVPPLAQPFTTTTYRPPSVSSPQATPLSLSRVHSLEMEQTSTFRDLFNAALQDYQNQTGNSLIDHPFAKKLESCNSVDSITSILEEQAQIFRDFRGDDGKLVKSIKYSVNVLYTLSTNTASIGLVRQKPFINILCF